MGEAVENREAGTCSRSHIARGVGYLGLELRSPSSFYPHGGVWMGWGN